MIEPPEPSLRQLEREELEAVKADNRRLRDEIERHNRRMDQLPTLGSVRPDAPDGLRILAHWFDVYYNQSPGDDNREVQEELLRWADEIEQYRVDNSLVCAAIGPFAAWGRKNIRRGWKDEAGIYRTPAGPRVGQWRVLVDEFDRLTARDALDAITVPAEGTDSPAAADSTAPSPARAARVAPSTGGDPTT